MSTPTSRPARRFSSTACADGGRDELGRRSRAFRARELSLGRRAARRPSFDATGIWRPPEPNAPAPVAGDATPRVLRRPRTRRAGQRPRRCDSPTWGAAVGEPSAAAPQPELAEQPSPSKPPAPRVAPGRRPALKPAPSRPCCARSRRSRPSCPTEGPRRHGRPRLRRAQPRPPPTSSPTPRHRAPRRALSERQSSPAPEWPGQTAAASSSRPSTTSSISSSASAETCSPGSWLRSVPLARLTQGSPAAHRTLASEPPPVAM